MTGKKTLEGCMIPRPMRIETIIDETYNVRTFRLRPTNGGNVEYSPGQFNMLSVFGVGEIPVTASSDPYQSEYLDHTVRAVGSVTNVMFSLKAGDHIMVRGPFGTTWPMKEMKGKDVMVVGGGIGLNPLKSVIIGVSRRRSDYGKLYVLHGARTPQDLLFTRDYDEWGKIPNSELHITVDAGDDKWRGNVGVVTTLFDKFSFDPARTVALLCGPEVMMYFTAKELLKRGLPSGSLYLSMERHMRCGIGFCGHCQMGPFFICKDGPIFAYDSIGKFFGVRQI
jgi:NAD(P)H-flavin reductase